MGSSLPVTQTGLQAVENAMSAVSDNLANSETDGFKSQEVDFATLLGEYIDGDALGGGAVANGVSTNFSQGSVVQTNSSTNLAIQGNGFFMLQEGSGATDYTRNGNMTIGSDGSLLAFNGANVMGYAVNSSGVASGALAPIVIPQGAIAPAASSSVGLTGNLDAGSAPITGTIDPTNPATYTSSVSVQLYDSLGKSHTLTVYYQNAGPTTSTPPTDQWNWTATLDGSATGLTNNSGSIQFNSAGAVVSGGAPSSPLTAAVAGAAPLSLGLNFSQLTQFGTASSLSGTADGNAAGQPVGVSINNNGGVSVTYSNGQSANVGQIAIATFTAEQGLVLGANGTFQQSDASGAPTVQAAGAGSAGTLESSALESSNVNITNELVNLVVLQQSFQANSKALQVETQTIGSVLQLQTT